MPATNRTNASGFVTPNRNQQQSFARKKKIFSEIEKNDTYSNYLIDAV
jgi:hypothetical protein